MSKRSIKPYVLKTKEALSFTKAFVNGEFPLIFSHNEFNHDPFYLDAIKRIMANLVPPDFFEGEHVLERFQDILPMISWTSVKEPPFDLSFFLCCRHRPQAFRFFHEMITKWLIPGRRMNTLLQCAVDFHLPHLGEERYVGAEVMIRIEHRKECLALYKSLPIIEAEMRKGVESCYQARRILEIKGLSLDEKVSMIQENIASLIKYKPQNFDYDIFSEMQKFFVRCPDEFKAKRSARHLTKIISTLYLFKKALRLSHENFPDRRYVSVKLIRGSLERQVLGLVIAISYLSENEILEKIHILSAIKTILPDAHLVEDIFLQCGNTNEPVHTFYLEVDKPKEFSLQEIKKLKESLPGIVKQRIEKKLHPIFMPENEEEIMRNILTLSAELKYIRDLPQCIISFNKQTEDGLEFSIVFVRITSEKERPLAEKLLKNTLLTFYSKKTKVVGTLRNKYKKEANVFHVILPKLPFLRLDHSVDFYKARADLVQKLTSILGEFRDYNGGMISKETELFSSLYSLLGEKAERHLLLLEEYFYAFSPTIMRSVLPADPLKKLFNMLLDLEEEDFEKDSLPFFKLDEDNDFCYILIVGLLPSLKEEIAHTLEHLHIPGLHLAMTYTIKSNQRTLGILFRQMGEETLLSIRFAIEKTMTSWQHKKIY